MKRSCEPSKNFLYDVLRNYKDKGHYSFHMPGHKGNPEFLETEFLDYTELEGLDNLHAPAGPIKNTQQRAAEMFGGEECFLLVNGSTAGIMAAVCSLGMNKKVLAARNSHRSFYSGLIFSGSKAVFIYPEMTPWGFCGGVDPKEVETALKTNADIGGVFIVSPTYEGVVSPLKEIADIAHKYNKPLIVDEAHGAHFAFHPAFPVTALAAGADIVIQSLHKTLPALTSCALLHVQGRLVNRDKLKSLLSMFQTSSPSYVLMASIDRCLNIIEEDGVTLFRDYVSMLESFRKNFEGGGVIRLLGQELAGQYGIFDTDPGKLVFTIEKGAAGKEIYDRLRDEYKMQLEMHGLRHVLAMTSICDSERGLSLLKKALETEAKRLAQKAPKAKALLFRNIRTAALIAPRPAFFGEKESRCLKEAAGCIAGDFIVPYPPGIPLLVPGEEITGEVIESVGAYEKAGVQIMGLSEGDIVITSPSKAYYFEK